MVTKMVTETKRDTSDIYNHDSQVLHLNVPFDLVRDLRPVARRHRTSVDRLILDLLLKLIQKPSLLGRFRLDD
jgi:hypothetical protein